jgi:hypothetical protein
MNRITGATLAAAAATLFSLAAYAEEMPTSSDASKEVKCAGINSCKGTSMCKTADNACKGQNVCKGHGWLPAASAKACSEQGGKVL